MIGNHPPAIMIQKLAHCVIINRSGSAAAVVCLQINQNTLHPPFVHYTGHCGAIQRNEVHICRLKMDTKLHKPQPVFTATVRSGGFLTSWGT